MTQIGGGFFTGAIVMSGDVCALWESTTDQCTFPTRDAPIGTPTWNSSSASVTLSADGLSFTGVESWQGGTNPPGYPVCSPFTTTVWRAWERSIDDCSELTAVAAEVVNDAGGGFGGQQWTRDYVRAKKAWDGTFWTLGSELAFGTPSCTVPGGNWYLQVVQADGVDYSTWSYMGAVTVLNDLVVNGNDVWAVNFPHGGVTPPVGVAPGTTTNDSSFYFRSVNHGGGTVTFAGTHSGTEVNPVTRHPDGGFWFSTNGSGVGYIGPKGSYIVDCPATGSTRGITQIYPSGEIHHNKGGTLGNYLRVTESGIVGVDYTEDCFMFTDLHPQVSEDGLWAVGQYPLQNQTTTAADFRTRRYRIRHGRDFYTGSNIASAPEL